MIKVYISNSCVSFATGSSLDGREGEGESRDLAEGEGDGDKRDLPDGVGVSSRDCRPCSGDVGFNVAGLLLGSTSSSVYSFSLRSKSSNSCVVLTSSSFSPSMASISSSDSSVTRLASQTLRVESDDPVYRYLSKRHMHVMALVCPLKMAFRLPVLASKALAQASPLPVNKYPSWNLIQETECR